MERVLAGRYELEVPVGRGGMGEVWRGRDMATRRPVAIKLVELSRIDDPGLLAETIGRFRREAEVVGGLKHQNIVGSLDAGRVGNQLYMIMELAPGISLASMMDERGARGMGLFPVASVIRIAEQVSSGLAAAHATGVVHRDIKPSNLMVTPQLGIKIIDFGIARLLADNSPRLTMRGHTVGTIAYMSPEQAQGDDVDPRSDLYSLGCVLYQLLSGRLPFRSAMPSALLMMQVMDHAIPLNAIRPDLPAGLPELVGDLMEKDRRDRPADAEQVLSRLAAISVPEDREQPEHEADRQTFRATDPPPPGQAETRLERVMPELGRATVLTPERLAGLSGPERGVPPWEMPPGQPAAAPPPGPGPYAPQGAPGYAPPGYAPPGYAPPGYAPPGYAPQGPPGYAPPPAAWNTPGRGNGQWNSGGQPPAWPSPPARRPRRRWLGLLSTLLTIAIAAGVWYYVWNQTHGKLQVTNVAVSAPKLAGCNSTTKITGVITTNGHGGPVSYEWTGPGIDPKPLVADDASGSDTVTVYLNWTFHGQGTSSATPELRVLAPNQAESSITFPYSCPS
jgi:serine/threonine protein kinase